LVADQHREVLVLLRRKPGEHRGQLHRAVPGWYQHIDSWHIGRMPATAALDPGLPRESWGIRPA
jgi:hypothetical protein